jgi:hypothetical protein
MWTFENMTEELVHQAAQKNIVAFGCTADTRQMMRGNSLPFSDLRVGEEFALCYDNGPAWNDRVADMKKLQWPKEGETQWREEAYRTFEAGE